MGFLYRENNNREECHQKFDRREDSISHTRKVHYQSIVKSRNRGMNSLLEEDRLNYGREERKRRRICVDTDK